MKSLILAFIGSMIMSTSGNTKPIPAFKSTTTSKPTSTSLHSIRVTDAAGLITNGTYDVSRFISANGRLWAVCKLRCIIGNIEIEEDCLVPITVGDCDGGTPRELNLPLAGTGDNTAKTTHCDCIVITFGNCSIRRITLSLDLVPQTVQCTVPDFPIEIICKINGEIREITTPREQIAASLNQLL